MLGISVGKYKTELLKLVILFCQKKLIIVNIFPFFFFLVVSHLQDHTDKHMLCHLSPFIANTLHFVSGTLCFTSFITWSSHLNLGRPMVLFLTWVLYCTKYVSDLIFCHAWPAHKSRLYLIPSIMFGFWYNIFILCIISDPPFSSFCIYAWSKDGSKNFSFKY